ncbi:nucleoside deaminase [Myxococcus sp. K15C18031901]|uniref:nucleoside deaminase n=1 Tax=Myxococcus dinghuensis TaxID=2906761 RepID=UPI0020A7507B|nr:nucleoside deaminase [Myxococcus dinghuensis]MCP3104701.1 nucleoside deaminase [Myxococcus dinghuensis]
MRPEETRFLHQAIDAARRAGARGNQPFGAVLVDAAGKVLLEGENTAVTERDCTGHAEANIMREATRRYPPDVLASSTMYASTEPCAMCAGAIFWGGVGRVVFALSSAEFGKMVGDKRAGLFMSCREVLERGSRPTQVEGPVDLREARDVHAGFWK